MTVEVIASSSAGNVYLLRQGEAAPLLLECGLPFK